jgi:predicted nucleic acid-binding protein
MSAVFGDTFYFLALLNRKDKAHRECVAFFESSDLPMITTTRVLLELGDALRRGRDRATFSALLDDLTADAQTTVIPAEQSVFEKATKLFEERRDKEWSLTDCTSFVVMREHGLSQALTHDHHFEQAGFTALFG